MKIMFCGASEGVTGSCHLITAGKYKFLIDCGKFQGSREEELKNFEAFPFDPKEIDFMILSHAHIDHSGRIPLLVQQGFNGKIYCTDATCELAAVMLEDAGHIHESEAERVNRKNERAGRPLVKPLYTVKDALDSLTNLEPVLYDQLIEVTDNIRIVFNDAGHIFGSSIVEIFIEERGTVSKIVFSGDLGVSGRPILRDPTIIKKADYVIMESTYGDRVHREKESALDELVGIIRKTVKRGGNVVIPAASMGRTQELLFELNRIFDNMPEIREELKDMKVYVDSPMSVKATEVYLNNAQVYDEELKKLIVAGDNPLDFEGLNFAISNEASKAINTDKSPKIIIAASAMCEAGRIRHHLKHNLWDAKNSIVFVGYQGRGTTGAHIRSGAETVRLFNEEIAINAEVYSFEGGFSGHADREGLLDWVKGFQLFPKQIFLVHGDPEAKEGFRDYVRGELGFECTVVTGNSEYELETGELITEIYSQVIEDKEAEIADIRERIGTIEDVLDNVLRNAGLAVTDDLSAKRVAEIKNILLELEKSAYNLGAIATEEDREVH